MLNRVGQVREIQGAARETPVGGMLAFRYSTGNLGTYWTRIEDDPAELGRMMLREAGRDDGALFCAEPADLRFYVRIEEVVS
jgi:hypothetical protein